ncbi:hypothetical protein TIFTF001_016248 [Ficus carica]|uniref:Uncharacterized protein n=1 Tax=Ficus carica TaxID=3494 RepID=A0AA88D8L4_FICCA|nr:hypothetical protein TIFTF001_016248 [Ficus carica]
MPLGGLVRRQRLACRRFSDPKDEDLTIAGRLLGVEVTTGLGGLRFDEMEEPKGRGFDDTFRLSALAVVVNFLSAAFPVLIDFHFVLYVFLNNNDGLPIVWARGLFARFRSSRFVDPARLVAMQSIWLSLRSEVMASN